MSARQLSKLLVIALVVAAYFLLPNFIILISGALKFSVNVSIAFAMLVGSTVTIVQVALMRRLKL
jgi:hypothetical protein